MHLLFRPATLFLLFITVTTMFALSGCRDRDLPVKLSFVLTNDIHGQLEPLVNKAGKSTGGMAYLASIVDSIRKQDEYASDRSALFVLDSGDQFQGTLTSNFNEGRTVFDAMSAIGYDAVVPGNHDYDFGPFGWLYDKVTDGKTSANKREVIETLAARARFPLLSANTYLKSSIRFSDQDQNPALDSKCRLSDSSSDLRLDFKKAKRPDFLRSHVILKKAGVRVALIGIDNTGTASSTTIENVDDLCFRDEVETYLEIRRELENQADVFVLMMHNGNSDNNKEASEIVRKINQTMKNGVHLVAAGHTHFVHDDVVDGVHILQNGDKTKFFGRVDLVYHPITGTILNDLTRSKAGIATQHDTCQTDAGDFCSEYTTPILPQQKVQQMVADAAQEVATLAKRKLGEVTERITRNRTGESAMGNHLTDALRAAAGTQIALMNTGGIRSDFAAGELLYENLFEVLPFSNFAVKVNAAKWSTLRKVLTKSIQSCGRYGSLVQSGLKIRFTRNCRADIDVDQDARLETVETNDGRILLDRAQGIQVGDDETFSLVTMDFLAVGGSGYGDLKEVTVNETLAIAREMIADQLEKTKPRLQNKTDGRLRNSVTNNLSGSRE
jgi:2',3'-cyclic-nucleotide 2'-phosphodiesterase (5'-nucleotidase family)